MKKIHAVISPYKSPFYPVQVHYTKDNVKYHEVFETVKQAKSELSWRFYDGILYQIKYTERGF